MALPFPPNYYQVLNVPRTIQASELKTEYRKLALQWHPDKHPTAEAKATATKRMSAINEAYGVLSDPAKRLNYDMQLRLRDPFGDTETSRPHHRPPQSRPGGPMPWDPSSGVRSDWNPTGDPFIDFMADILRQEGRPRTEKPRGRDVSDAEKKARDAARARDCQTQARPAPPPPPKPKSKPVEEEKTYARYARANYDRAEAESNKPPQPAETPYADADDESNKDFFDEMFGDKPKPKTKGKTKVDSHGMLVPRATYTRLYSGEWGIRVTRERGSKLPNVGDLIEVQKKDGSKRKEQVSAIVWVGSDREGFAASICEIIRRPGWEPSTSK